MSKTNKILLFGKHGQVGHELQSTLHALGEVFALDVESTDGCGDFSRPDDVIATVRHIKPDIIVNAAAYTAVDKAESEPELARIINATTPGALAAEAEKLGAWFVHYSTDYVFDGSGDKPWQETDTPSPINTYGKTKLEGEQLIAKACKRHLILRTSWVYGVHGNNFAKTMLRLAQERDSLAVVDDQIGAPTSARLLAELTVSMLQKAIENESLAGLYHAVAAGDVSWYGYAKFVIAHARSRGSQIKVLDSDIKPVTSDQFPTPAKRPHNSRLSTLKLQQAFDIKLPEWQAGVTQMLTESSKSGVVNG
ncbi:MAG: dTDP-4-dehydrorhamnose reductase [Methylophilaceae bacterium]|nr:dTDP-4-dehydrorhamnose reductase [Methylophilaceae bacterium]